MLEQDGLRSRARRQHDRHAVQRLPGRAHARRSTHRQQRGLAASHDALHSVRACADAYSYEYAHSLRTLCTHVSVHAFSKCFYRGDLREINLSNDNLINLCFLFV